MYVVVQPILVSDLAYSVVLLEACENVSIDDRVQRYTMQKCHYLFCVLILSCRVSYVEKYGTRYSKGNMVFCAITDDLPLFGKISDILVLPSGECLFSLVSYVGKYFSFAYELHQAADNIIFNQKNLIDLSLCKSFSRSLSLFV